MAAVWYCVRAEFRARLWARLALVALIAVTSGVVLTAAAGARRTASAFSRLIQATNAADVMVNPDKGVESRLDPAAVGRLPLVAETGHAAGMLIFDPDADDALLPLASADGRFGYSIDRPNVLHGRLPRPDRADEVLVDPVLADQYNVAVGSTLSFVSARGADLQQWDEADGREDQQGSGPPPVTRERLTVTGIGVFSNNVVQDEHFAFPTMFLTPAYYRTHPGQETYFGVAARLKPGVDTSAFRTATDGLSHEGLLEYQTLTVTADKVQRAVRPQAVALGLFALVVAATGLFVIGQAAARQLFAEAIQHAPLSALGLGRRELFVTAIAPFALTAVLGIVLGIALAVAGSALMPVGPSRQAEPHRGISVDLLALGAGGVALLSLLLAIAALAAWRLARDRGRQVAEDRARRVSKLAGALAGAGARPTAVTGVRLALESGRGSTAVPTRSSLVGAGAAVATVAAALTFAASLNHLVSTPRLFGWNWDIAVELFPDDTEVVGGLRDDLETKLNSDAGVEQWAATAVSRVSLNGMNVPAVGYEPGRGDVGPTIVTGRLPRDGEIALGRRTLTKLGVAQGDTVTARLGDRTRELRVVGRSVLPGFGTYEGSDKTELGAGAVVSLNDLTEIAPDFGHYLYLLELSAPAAAVQPRLLRGFNPNDVRAVGVQRPAEIANYGRLRTTPLVLAGVLAALAAATVTHALVAAVRRRRRDFAILKTLGFVRRQVSTTVAWQASTVLTLALLVGLPIGVAAGRWAWTLVARQLGTAAEPVTPLLAVLLSVPAGLLLANLVAAVPARVASRLKPATVLRSE